MPFPGQRIIPANWSARHRPVAAGFMTSTCTVRRVEDGPAPFPLPDGWEPPGPIWSGACRFQQHNRETATDVAGQPTEARRHLIAFPIADDNPLPSLRVGERGDVVTIRGKQYTLRQRLDSSEEWQHDFIAEENQTQNNP